MPHSFLIPGEPGSPNFLMKMEFTMPVVLRLPFLAAFSMVLFVLLSTALCQYAQW